MPLRLVEAAHLQVTCDACRTATAELCTKRDPPDKARAAAAVKFKAAGWHNDPPARVSARAEKEAVPGAGKWICPSCGRSSHL